MTNRITNHPATSLELNFRVFFLLHNAVRQYESHIDLFSSTYYLRNSEKRILAEKRYALFKACEKFTNSETNAMFNIFEALFIKPAFGNPVFLGYDLFAEITDYNCLKRRLKQFRNKNIASCTHTKSKP